MTKTCTKCKLDLPVQDFPMDRSRKTGRSERCDACNRLHVRLWTSKDPKRARILNRKACKKRRVEGKVDRAKERYGLSRDQVLDMLEAQDDRCAICFQYGFAPHVDHSHASGALRDLLCFGCNAALGQVKESIPRLHSAIKYLSRHSG